MRAEHDAAVHGERHVVTFANAGRTISVPDNANLREACLREGVRLYFGLARITNCGGRARCGTCRVRVLDGADHLSAPTPIELPHLRPDEPDARLACQANVRGPVTVDTRG